MLCMCVCCVRTKPKLNENKSCHSVCMCSRKKREQNLIISKRTPSRPRTKNRKTFKFSPTEKKKGFFVQFNWIFCMDFLVSERVSYRCTKNTRIIQTGAIVFNSPPIRIYYPMKLKKKKTKSTWLFFRKAESSLYIEKKIERIIF